MFLKRVADSDDSSTSPNGRMDELDIVSFDGGKPVVNDDVAKEYLCLIFQLLRINGNSIFSLKVDALGSQFFNYVKLEE